MAKKAAKKVKVVEIDPLTVKSSNKVDPKNVSKVRFRDFSPDEERVILFVSTSKKPVTVKEIAAACVNGDYLKAKNLVRRPRWTERIKMGPGRGEYSKA